jgi:hypothetical protein
MPLAQQFDLWLVAPEWRRSPVLVRRVTDVADTTGGTYYHVLVPWARHAYTLRVPLYDGI